MHCGKKSILLLLKLAGILFASVAFTARSVGSCVFCWCVDVCPSGCASAAPPAFLCQRGLGQVMASPEVDWGAKASLAPAASVSTPVDLSY